MKVVATLFAAATLAALASAAPGTNAVNYNAVAAKVAEIESSIRGSAQQAISTATNANGQIGNVIATKINAAGSSAALLLQQANDAISAQRFTVGQARELQGKLKSVIGQTYGNIQRDLSQLPPAATAQIRAIHQSTLRTLDAQVGQLSALLVAGGNRSFRAVDWDAVSGKVGELEEVVRHSGQEIVDAASNDDEQVANTIADKVKEASVDVAVILQQANDAVSAQTLTVGQTRELVGQLKGNVNKLLGNIQPELSQLAALTAARIRATFVATTLTADVKADEISELLAA